VPSDEPAARCDGPVHPDDFTSILTAIEKATADGTQVAVVVRVRDEARSWQHRRLSLGPLGGEPFAEPLLMSWNFVARTRDEIDQARLDWMSGSDRFGPVASSLPRIPAPSS
jgi:redox-sensitive bicupin YhaK (pirin superfamily)